MNAPGIHLGSRFYDIEQTYESKHSLGDIVTALVRHAVPLNALFEHDWTVWPRFPWLVRETDATWTARPEIPASHVRLPCWRVVGQVHREPLGSPE